LTEFGIEESWRATWQAKQPIKLRDVELQVSWFRGTHNKIPSFATVEIRRKTPTDYQELRYIELPLNSASSTEDNQHSIEEMTENILLTPMDHLLMLLIAR
jgi:hypothetical protein